MDDVDAVHIFSLQPLIFELKIVEKLFEVPIDFKNEQYTFLAPVFSESRFHHCVWNTSV